MKNLGLLAGLLLGLVLAQGAQAHRFAPSLLKVTEIAPHQYNVVWKTPVQGTSSIPLRPEWPDSCEITSSSPPQLEGTGRVDSWQLRCDRLGEDGLVGDTLGVDGLGPNQASALVMVNLLDGRNYQQVLNAEKTAFVIPAESSAGEVAGDYSLLGIEHIWGGMDHLMFVFGLLLLVGGGSRLLWTITAFTLGHSITLSLVTLGYFDYPVALVEFAIAFSIFVLAVELTRTSRHDVLWRNPWWLAGGFGLLHGMGFAGALAETGLPQDNLPLALLFFNVGVELGQLAFIGAVFAVSLLFKRIAWPVWAWRVPVYSIGSMAAFWTIQRIAGFA